MTVTALIVAAGRGVRAGGEIPKQYRMLGGKSVLRRTVEAFLGVPEVTAIQIVIHPDDIELYAAAVAGLDLQPPAFGGATRQESVRLGLKTLNGDGLVLVHDAARCHVSLVLISSVIAMALDTGAGVVPALPVTDTVKRGEGSLVLKTVPRDGLFRIQTPQAFPCATLKAVHEDYAGEELTDDAALFEAAGLAVHLVPGDPANIKLTAPEDFVTTMESRSGLGFDVHRLEPGDGVWLAGIKIPFHQKLKGHSDADVATHALVDALLGAISAGDIGEHFPPSDPQWKGASSDRFLAHARDLIVAKGGVISHVDVTLMCEAPKLTPHKLAMRARLAEILAIDISRVSVKATTTEKLGFTGRGEGIAAQAIATVRLPVSS